MPSSPQLSVVIPTFNTAAMTLICCRSALDASPEGTEIIAVDDASTDGTRELLAREVPDVAVVRLDDNRRFSGASNAGVNAARGKIILLLNSDTRVQEGALTALLAAFAEDPGLGVAGARLLDPDGAAQWSGARLPTLAWLFVMISGSAPWLPHRRHTKAAKVDWVSGAAMAFRREVWESCGPLRDTYRFYAQDLDFCARARSAGWKVRIVESARVVHEGGTTVRAWRGVHELPHDPAMLWMDMLTWGRAHYGPRWGMAAKAVAVPAALLRITGRALRGLTLRGEERRQWQSSTRRFVAALRELLVKRKETSAERLAREAALDDAASGVADRTRH